MAEAKTESPKIHGQIVHDLELVTMQKISRLLDKLDGRAKVRVVEWVVEWLKSKLVDATK